MILLTKLDGQHIIINENFIESVQQAPDTILTLINGKVYVVTETTEEVIKKVREFQKLGLK